MQGRRVASLLASVAAGAAFCARASDVAALFDGLALAAPLKPYADHNPIMTQKYGADPFVISHGGRVYVYMTSDAEIMAGGVVQKNDYSNCKAVRVVSSADLVNWTEHPAIKVAGPDGPAPWAGVAWAPSAAYRTVNGRTAFFLYFANGAGGIGVLRADSPTGPFTDPLGRALISRSTEGVAGVVWLFDPGVFVDDDGRAYIYFGGGVPEGKAADPGTMRVAELGPDMTSLVPGSVKAFPVPYAFEASAMNKVGDTYYYTYCVNFNVPPGQSIQSGTIAYMTSKRPTDGFELKSTLLQHPGAMFGIKGGNNHQDLFEFKGRHYIAYHSRVLAAYMGYDDDGKPSAEGTGYRSTHIDAIGDIADGTMPKVAGTRKGVAQVGHFDPYQVVEAATIGAMAGISTAEYRPEGAAAGRMKVTGIHPGDWIAVYGVDFGSGAKQFRCRVTPPPAGGAGAIQIRRGGLDGTPVGYVKVEPGKADYTVDLLQTVAGAHDLVFVFHGTGWDFEEWQFIK